MVNDPIGDMLTQIRNAAASHKTTLGLPASRLKQAVAKILVEEGYLTRVEQVGSGVKTSLNLGIKYEDKIPALTGLKRMSKPGLRVYVGAKEIPTVVGGLGITILSTPKGIMSGKAAKKLGIGGELLCEVW